MGEVSTDEVISAFEDLGLDLEDPKVIDLLASLCDIYHFTADKISTEVMAFMYSKKMSATTSPTLEVLTSFEDEFLKKTKEKKSEPRRIVDVTNLLCADANEEEEVLDDDLMSSYNIKSTPKRNLTPENETLGRRKALKTSLPFSPSSYETKDVDNLTPNSRRYQNRANAGATVISFGNKFASSWKIDKATFTANIKDSALHRNLKEPYRFMFEGLRDKAGHLDEIICKITDLLVEKHELDEPQDFNQTLPNTFVCAGRICCDSADGRLNAHSILIQGSQDTCNGKSLAMDTSRVNEYSMFPGQVIVANAFNPNGSRVIAGKIYADVSVRLPETRDKVTTQLLSVLVCSGPYTTSDNLQYEPLRDFLRYVTANQPHVVIMTGPFLDERHPLIESGQMEETFESLFDRIVKMIIDAIADSHTRIVLVPSARDVHHISIYPTPPFSSHLNGLALPDSIKMVSDPCMLDIEGIVFGVTATDIMFQLGKEEISFPPGSRDRLRRLASHIIQQRSFYPLYPPSEEINLDVEQLEAHGTLQIQPHVLILPSEFMHFFKDLNGGLLMNPSRLAKSESGGVFARLLIHPQNEAEAPFLERIQAEIVRI